MLLHFDESKSVRFNPLCGDEFVCYFNLMKVSARDYKHEATSEDQTHDSVGMVNQTNSITLNSH